MTISSAPSRSTAMRSVFGGGAVGDGLRTARRAYPGHLGLDSGHDVAAKQRPGRARVDGDELASTGGLQLHGKRECVAAAFTAVDADNDAREHRGLPGSRTTTTLRGGNAAAIGERPRRAVGNHSADA